MQVTHRGYFVPPRPEKHVAQGNKLSAKFVDKRRAALQHYLKRLSGHRCAAASSHSLICAVHKCDRRQTLVGAASGSLSFCRDV